MIENDAVLKMTRKGRRLARAGKFPPGMSDEARLMAAIVSMADNRGMRFDNFYELMNEMLGRYDGDFDAAIDAVLSGKVGLDEIRLN